MLNQKQTTKGQAQGQNVRKYSPYEAGRGPNAGQDQIVNVYSTALAKANTHAQALAEAANVALDDLKMVVYHLKRENLQNIEGTLTQRGSEVVRAIERTINKLDSEGSALAAYENEVGQ